MATSKAKKREVLDEVVDALKIIEDALLFIDKALDDKDIIEHYSPYGYGKQKWVFKASDDATKQRVEVMRLIGELESGSREGLFDRLLKAKCSG